MRSSKLVKAAAADQQLPYLPSEIISEFLMRLPVRILFKLCCVSKQWYALITDPIFRASYRSRSKQNPPRILLQYNSAADRGVGFSSLDNKDRKLHPIGRFKFMNESFRVLPCLDLVCLYNRINMYIWNPATGEHIQLPESCSITKRSSFGVAFGYLASTAEYKLLHTTIDATDKFYCEILTLGSDQQWKGTNGPPSGSYRRGVASCFRGAAYLVQWPDRDLVRFDLEREEWTSIEGPKPENLSSRQYATLKLTEVGGSLCLTDCHMHLGTAIWFLEDYNKGSWVLKYNIDVSPICAGIRKMVVPLVIEKDGRVLLHIHQTVTTLYYYEPRSKSFEKIYFGRGILMSAGVYIESFKSLKFEG